jgi:hypothetical protein
LVDHAPDCASGEVRAGASEELPLGLIPNRTWRRWLRRWLVAWRNHLLSTIDQLLGALFHLLILDRLGHCMGSFANFLANALPMRGLTGIKLLATICSVSCRRRQFTNSSTRSVYKRYCFLDPESRGSPPRHIRRTHRPSYSNIALIDPIPTLKLLDANLDYGAKRALANHYGASRNDDWQPPIWIDEGIGVVVCVSVAVEVGAGGGVGGDGVIAQEPSDARIVVRCTTTRSGIAAVDGCVGARHADQQGRRPQLRRPMKHENSF